jgi:hypothetical protein
MTISLLLRRAMSYDASEARTASIVRAEEFLFLRQRLTSLRNVGKPYQATWRHIPEDSNHATLFIPCTEITDQWKLDRTSWRPFALRTLCITECLLEHPVRNPCFSEWGECSFIMNYLDTSGTRFVPAAI